MTDRYNTPAKGTTDWHIPLNENFTDLDVDVEHRDFDTNKSIRTPADGAKFLATDTGAVYLGDGDDWNQIGSIRSSTQRFTEQLDASGGTSPTRRWGVFIADGETIEVTRAAVAIWDSSGSFTTDAGVELVFSAPGGSDLALADAGALTIETGDPLASVGNSTGTAQFGYIEVQNTTTSQVTAWGEFDIRRV